MKKNIRQVLAVLTPKERKIFRIQSGAEILIALCDIVFLVLLVMIIATIAGSETRLETYLPEGALREKPLLLLGIFVCCYAGKNFLGWLLLKAQYHFYYDVAGRLSGENLAAYLQSDYSNYVKTDSSVHTRKIAQQPVEFAHYVLRGWQTIISQSALLLITTNLLLIYNAALFALLLSVLLPPFALLFYYSKKKEAAIRHDIKSYSERSMQYLKEALAGYVEHKIYARNRFFNNRYSKYQEKLNSVLAGRQILQGSSSRVMEVFALLGLFVIVLASQTGTLAISAGTVAAFIGAAYKLIPGAVKIMNHFGQVKAYEFTIESVKTLPTVNNRSESNIAALETIAFRNVVFSYGEQVLLNKLNFSIRKGELAGLSGISGKGKTTLVNLVLGFIKPQEGEILINGKPAQPGEGLWKRVSYAKQQSFLLNDSAEKNITFSDDVYDEKRFSRAYKKAGLQSFNLSAITEDGRNISGGQRQRVAFARALYKDFDLLILDEPFSEMDRDAELQMMDELKDLAASGKMILLITHYKQALESCHKIISLDE